MSGEWVHIVIPLSDFDPHFSLSRSLISYGHVLLAPNKWRPAPISGGDPDVGSVFSRPLRVKVPASEQRAHGDEGGDPPMGYHEGDDGEEGAVEIRLWQEGNSLVIEHGNVVFAGKDGTDRTRDGTSRNRPDASIMSQVVTQIKRMIRYGADLSRFHSMNPTAKSRAWGRTYCAPNLWEDLVKTITNCNMQWKGTCDMNRKLCSQLGTPLNSFPTPREISNFTADQLKTKCRLGYRCKWILKIAQHILSINLLNTRPSLSLSSIERHLTEGSTDQKHDARIFLASLPGIGPFALANILQLCGDTSALPFDTETCRLWAEENGASSATDKKNRDVVMKEAEEYYRRRFPGEEWRAYWFDLWRNYERRTGCESVWWEIPTGREGEAAFSHSWEKDRRQQKASTKGKSSDNGMKGEDHATVNQTKNITHVSVSVGTMSYIILDKNRSTKTISRLRNMVTIDQISDNSVS